MTNQDKSPRVYRPVILLGIGVCVNCMLLLWVAWQSYGSYHYAGTTTRRHARMEELRGVIIHLDEVLTMSARMAAATGDSRWERRYRRFEPQLDKAIKEAVGIEPEMYDAELAAKTDSANIKLVEMENRAFDLIRRGDADEARTVLASDEYMAQKDIYAQGMAEFADRLSNAVSTGLAEERARAFWNVTTGILMIALMIAGWYLMFRAVRGWAATLREKNHRLTRQADHQKRLSQSLDLKVAARTAELSRTNEELQAEISQREQAQDKLKSTVEELARFNRLAVGRETRMIELKRQVNEMARKAGVAPPYDLAFADTGPIAKAACGEDVTP